MSKITGWVVITRTQVYGPWDDAGEAAAWLQEYYDHVTGPVEIRAIIRPLKTLRCSPTDLVLK